MKTITLITIYLVSFALFFLMLSCFGMLWQSYRATITSQAWFMIYSTVIGWWMAVLPAREYWMINSEYFERVF